MNQPLRNTETEGGSALFLAESVEELNAGANFLSRLTHEEWRELRRAGSETSLDAGAAVFMQGDAHEGIWLIERGLVRTFYAAPSGRQITLAYWPAGHFVGGPELFGGGQHVWSADVVQPCKLLYLPARVIRGLIQRQPAFALCLIEGLVAKGKCYSALVQMLGTRSVVERLTQLLVILAENHGRREGNRLFIDRKLTHDQIATIVGSTRQWVTMTLDKLQKKGIISVARQQIVIERYDLLMTELDA
ncbi:MAG TPA: Crp/Fnr family transcriptional regulator [Pseudolabrys sp.]|nr:Crp/Fnr family transcriptional regulator [Pseudolabrys sp.]